MSAGFPAAARASPPAYPPGRLHRGRGAPGVARARVPGARHDALVVDDRIVADMDPVAERAARRLVEAGPEAIARPTARDPTLSCLGCDSRGGAMLSSNPRTQLSINSTRTCASIARAATRPRVENSAVGSYPERRQGRVGQLLDPRTPCCVSDQHARQRPDLHRLAIIARRLHPAVFVRDVQPLIGRLRPGIVRRGLAFERIQSLVVADRIIVP